MYAVWDVHLNRETRNFGGAEWVVDGERGRETYPATISKEDAVALYRKGE